MTELSNVGKFLDFLGAAEGAGYNTIVGGGSFSSYDKHPGTVGLVTKDGPSTAAGKYQITKTTYDDIAPKLGITDFSPQSQDRIALELIRRNGSLADVQSGNFEAAIAKNGGTWASLPSSPYNQPKRSSDWVNQYFGGRTTAPTTPPPALQNQATDAPIAPTYNPGASEMALREAQNEAKNGGIVNGIKNIPEAVSLGFQTQNYLYNAITDAGLQKVDQNFTYTKDIVDKATAGISPEYHGYILSGVSEQDVFRRRAKMEDALKKQQELASMGAVGVGGTLVGSLVDLPTLIGFLPGLGTASVISKTNRLKNALATGIAMSAGNVAGDALLASTKPLATDSDLYWSAAAGLAFGLPMGAMATPGRALSRTGSTFAKEVDDLAKFGQKTASTIQKQEIEQAGMVLTEKGKKQLDPIYRQEQVAKQEIEAIRQEAKSIPVHKTESIYTEFVPTNKGGKPYPVQSTRDFLTKLAKEVDQTIAAPARRLLEQLGEDLPFYVVPKSTKALNGRPGVYYSESHIAVLSREAKLTTQVHEIAHAMTVHRLDFGKANPETAIGRITSEIEGLYKQAMDEAQKQGFQSYYLKNIREFTAGLYGGSSAKPFVEFLSKIKVDDEGKTLLNQFVDAMRRILGFDDKEMNLYLKSLGLTDQLIDEKLQVKIAGKSGKADREFNADYEDYMPHDKSPNVGYTQYGPALENFFTREWVPQQARDIFHKLAGSTTGYKNHAVVSQSAWDQTLALGDGWAARLDKAFKPAFNNYFQELMDKGEATRWKRAEVFDKWEVEVGNYIRGIEGDYHPSVIKVGNEIRSILKDAADHINNPGKFNGTVKRGLTQVEEIDPETGVAKLSDPLPYNENYLPRHPDTSKFNSMTAQFGPETVQRYFANSFKAANPDVDAKVAERFGRWYFNNLQDSKLNRANSNLEHMLRGYDRESLKESFMKHGNMTDDEAQNLIMAMFGAKKDKADPLSRNMKSRSSLDERYTEDVLLPDGSTFKMGLNDFIDTRTMDVLEGYFRRTAGTISLANQMDVYKMSDIDKMIKNATVQQFGSALPSDRLASLTENLNFTFDRIMGRPVEEFTVGNKLLEMWRGLNVTRLMGGAVYNQVQELSQIIGSMGWKTTLKAIPELRALMRDVKTGAVKNEMLDQLENLTGGAGADMLRRTQLSPRDEWVRQRGDTPLNQWLDRADNALSQTSSGVLKYTGMTGVMIQQKRIHAIAMINHFVDAANGKAKLAFSKERLAWMGLDEADTQKVLDTIKQYHKDVAGSKTGMVDFEKWQATDPESYAKFIVAYQREARRVVQENDLASMIPIMGKSWGQTMFQFMNFSMQGWNKSLGFAMNHKDYQTLSTVLHGSLFAAVTYIARTQQQMAGMSAEEKQAFAEKRLSTKQIVANSVGRIAQVSLLPMLIDSTIAPTPIFSGARTTSNVTDFIGSNPTLSAVSTALAMPRKLALASGSSETQVSEKDVRNWMKLLPMNNVVGISNVLNSIAADFPNTDKQE